MTTEPVTQFFAPRARLVDVATGNIIGEGFGGDPQSEQVALDLISARVTLVNSGVGQLQVVLNNQIFGPEGLPAVPPWLYNGLDRLKFGQRIRLDLCYGDQAWTKMIVAQINDMQFSFPAGGGAQVTVIAEDLLCVLKRKRTNDSNEPIDHRYPAGQTEADIVEEVVASAQRPAPGQGDCPEVPPFAFAGSTQVDGARRDDGYRELRGSLVEWPALTEQLPSVTHQKSQTYLQFVQSIAERMDFEVFVDFAINYVPLDEPGEAPQSAGAPAANPDPNPNEVLLHFEPARSRLNGGPPSFVADLAWGLNLLEFTPRLKLWDLPISKLKVTGRNPSTVDRVKIAVDSDDELDAIINGDMGRVPGGPFLIPATALRRKFLCGLPSVAPLDVEFTNLGPERALLLARSKLLEKARELLTVEAQTIGFPSLRPGIHVDVSGLYAPFDGLYYVTKTVHSFDASGYKTQLSLRRPGLQDPDEYAWSLASGRRPGVVADTPQSEAS